MIEIEDAELRRAMRLFHNLPPKLKTVVARRVLGRVKSSMATHLARHVADRTKLPLWLARRGMTVRGGEDSTEVRVRTKWPTRFEEMGGRAASIKRAGANLKGSYAHAFIASMKSGHTGIFQRTGGMNSASGRRNAIEELHGPNVAKHVNINPDEYGDLIGQIAEKVLLPRLLHEAGRAFAGN